MKFRNGFVSNSSSSSFCIYGACFEFDEEMETKIKKAIKDKYYGDDAETTLDDISMQEFGEIAPENILIHTDNYGGDAYIGREFRHLKKSETGKKFFDRTEKDIKEFVKQFGIETEDLKCSIIDHDYSC